MTNPHSKLFNYLKNTHVHCIILETKSLRNDYQTEWDQQAAPDTPSMVNCLIIEKKTHIHCIVSRNQETLRNDYQTGWGQALLWVRPPQ